MTDGGGRASEDGLVAGRYRVQECLGTGAMGAVWKAVDERLGRVVVVKRLLLAPGLSELEAEQARLRAMREGRIAARLQHANAVSVYDVTDDGGQPVLVMEYVPSRSLAVVLAERGTLPPREVAGIGAQVASALAAAHAAGIVHRDVKPGNILLGEGGAVKITDFGISRAVGDVTVTSTGLLAGTPAFMSPEAAMGHEPTPASDVFSLGSTLFAAVEGQPPFGLHDNPIALLHLVASGQIRPPVQAGPLAGLLMHMLHADPAARPTMAQAAEHLRAVASGQSGPDGRAVAPAAPVGVSRPARTLVDGPPVAPPGTAAASLGPAAAALPISRRTSALVAVLAVIVVLALGILIANALNRGDRSGTATAPTQQQPPNTQTVDPTELQRAVSEYYELVPKETDEAWQRLGPGLQAQGRERYERFWGGIEDLRVFAAPTVQGNEVQVGIEFTVKERGRFREVHALTMLVQNGNPLIDGDRVVSSQQIGDGKDDKKDDDDNGRGGGN